MNNPIRIYLGQDNSKCSILPILMTQIILASGSSYRKTQLAQLGLSFSVDAPNIDETANPHESVEELVSRLSHAKASAVLQKYPDKDVVIIGSDQVADLEGEMLTKPGNHAGAVTQGKSVKSLIFSQPQCLV